MIKLRILRNGAYPGLPGWHIVITKVVIRGRQGCQIQRRRCKDGSRGSE